MWSSPPFALLLLLLTVLYDSTTITAQTFLNIDCGASQGFPDRDHSLTWVADGVYIKSGVTHKLTNTTGVSQEETTLRAFPDKKVKKNCYTIPVESNRRLQVWVGLLYGNYDGKQKPPSFQLLLDSTNWGKVTLDTSSFSTSMIYKAAESNNNTTNICVARNSDDQDPFLSYIRMVTLDPGMYDVVNATMSLYNLNHYALGAVENIRRPDDAYDREWLPIDISDFVTLTNEAPSSSIDTSTCKDRPPTKLFEKAVAPSSGSKNLTITTSFLSSDPSSIYMNLYFTETNRSLTTKRAFHIYVDGRLISDASNPISPRFGEAIEFNYVSPKPDFYSDTIITLAPADGSTASPIVSGIEIHSTLEFSTIWTDSKDVSGLSLLQKSFKILQEWTGDPCRPTGYNWDWISCRTGPPTRVVRLFLTGFGLSGNLPDFSIMDALLTIDLQNNSLSGAVPNFLENFSLLQELNLADNDFSEIPSALKSSTSVKVNVTGNPKLCEAGKICMYGPNSTITEAPPPSTNRSKKFMSPSVSVLLLIFSIVEMVLCI